MTTAQCEMQEKPLSGTRPGASPDKVFETLTAFQQTAALIAAIDLDLFTAIGEGQNTAPALARKLNGTERGVRILCDFLTVIGFLTKSQDRYGLTAESAVFLDKRSQPYLGSAKNFLASPLMKEGFKDLAAVVRLGRPLLDHPFSATEHPIWVEFAQSMAPLLYLPAHLTSHLIDNQSQMRVLDVAAGHGIFGITIARRNPKAKIVALDFPQVLTVAQENASRAGVSSRYSLLSGNVLEIELGTGFDVVLVPNLMHSLDRAENDLLLKKIYEALAPKGRVVVVEFAPNEDRISPRIPALFALTMLANNTGDAYTISEHRAMLDNAGFSDCEAHPLLPTPFTAIIARKT